jgi:hypothetical protein
VRLSVEKVDRPVEGVDDPAAPARPLAACPLLCEQRVVGALALEESGDQLLGSAVGVRDEIGLGRLPADAARRLAEALEQQRARLARGPLGQLEVLGTAQKIARRIRTTPTTTTAIAPT